MRFKCIICGHIPEPTEQWIEFSAHLQTQNESKQGSSVMMCLRHIPHELHNALGLVMIRALMDYTSSAETDK